MGFVKFNKYQDVGFFPKGLNIDCCSKFLFLTTFRNKDEHYQSSTRLNLLVADPYYSQI